MAFWGIEVKPGRPFTYSTANDAKGRLRVSQATLGIGTATNKSILQCNVGSRSPVFLCSLLPDKVDSCPLNLEFEELEEVLFSVIGPRSVHLTGYYPLSGQHHNLHDESESYGEDIGETETERSASYCEDDKYEDSFINDSDPEVFPSLVSGEVEDTPEKKKSKNRKRRRGHLRKKYQVIESDDNTTPQQQMCADHHAGLVVVDSGSEDKLPISSLSKSIATTKNTKLETEERAEIEVAETAHYGNEDNGYSVSISESTKLQEKNAEGEVGDSGNNELKKEACETGNNKTEDDGNSVIISDSTGLQVKRNVEKEDGDRGNIEIKDVDNCVDASERKIGAVVDGEGNSRGGQPHSLLHPTTHVGPENAVKQKRKRKERVKDRILNTGVMRGSEANKHEGNSDCLGQNEPIVDEKKQKHTNIKILDNVQLFVDDIQSEEKKKRIKRSKKQENGEATITEISLLSMKEKNSSVFNIEKDNVPVINSSQRRTLSNELVIEELETGKLDGKIASLGKKISVNYVGKLKENGQVFDSSDGGPPFKFRLGSEGVLKGWSLGLEGMRVGGKRRLIIPPLLGYGNEGDGENVPPGSYLVYDFELIKVR